jgi:hypothetical protein
MEHRREEWKEDRTQRREVWKMEHRREECKENKTQKRGVEGRWSTVERSSRKMR